MTPDTNQYILLPDGTYAAVSRVLTFGDAVIILLLVALLFLAVYGVWRWR